MGSCYFGTQRPFLFISEVTQCRHWEQQHVIRCLVKHDKPSRGSCFVLGLGVWPPWGIPMPCTAPACVQQTPNSILRWLCLANQGFRVYCLSFSSVILLCTGAWWVQSFPEMLENNTLGTSQLAVWASTTNKYALCANSMDNILSGTRVAAKMSRKLSLFPGSS